MNGKPKQPIEYTVDDLREREQIERQHARKQLWRSLKAAFGWIALVGLMGAAWHDILDSLGRLIGRR